MSILEMVLRQLRFYGFEEVIICVGHKAELIMAVIDTGQRYGVKVRYHVETEPRGTMGALSEVDGLAENFLVMNGDICTSLNFRNFYEHHIQMSSFATVGVCPRQERIELGVLELDESEGQIVGFQEKPTLNLWVSMGVNALSREAIELIPKGEYFGFDTLVGSILSKKLPLRAYVFRGLWLDIGRPDDYEKILQEFEANRGAYLPEGA